MNSWQWTSVLYALHLLHAKAIYQDQIGELDWFIRNVGRVTRVAFPKVDCSDSPRIFVASDVADNAIASLHADTGLIHWRILLETCAYFSCVDAYFYS